MGVGIILAVAVGNARTWTLDMYGGCVGQVGDVGDVGDVEVRAHE